MPVGSAFSSTSLSSSFSPSTTVSSLLAGIGDARCSQTVPAASVHVRRGMNLSSTSCTSGRDSSSGSDVFARRCRSLCVFFGSSGATGSAHATRDSVPATSAGGPTVPSVPLERADIGDMPGPEPPPCTTSWLPCDTAVIGRHAVVSQQTRLDGGRGGGGGGGDVRVRCVVRCVVFV